ncbi:MAG: hypothetical protein ACTSPG_00890 [Candidatus Hodarchaeales archaeon]
MDIWSIIVTILTLGIVALLGVFLIVGILVLIYLALTGNRWD